MKLLHFTHSTTCLFLQSKQERHPTCLPIRYCFHCFRSQFQYREGTSYLIRQLTSALVTIQGFEPQFLTLEVGSYQLRRNRHSVTINASPLAENYLNLINILYQIYLNKSIFNCNNQKHKDNECNRYFPRQHNHTANETRKNHHDNILHRCSKS